MKLLMPVLSFSRPIWLCHPLCGLLPSGTCVRPPQQCHWSTAWCKEVCHGAETARCCENQRYRYAPCLGSVEDPSLPLHTDRSPECWGSLCLFTPLCSSSSDLRYWQAFSGYVTGEHLNLSRQAHSWGAQKTFSGSVPAKHHSELQGCHHWASGGSEPDTLLSVLQGSGLTFSRESASSLLSAM